MSISVINVCKSLEGWMVVLLCLLCSGCTNAQIEVRLAGEHTINYYRKNPQDTVVLKIPKGNFDYKIVGRLARIAVESYLYFMAETLSLLPRSKENNESFVYPVALLKQISLSIQSNYAVVLAERPGSKQTYSLPELRTT